MLVLDEFGFENIGRFVEPQTIDIQSLGNLIQVDAENNNTGGSSGSGKSTVFNAVDYLFGINDIPNTILQSRLTKNGMSVYAKGTLDGKPIKISRSKGKGLAIEGAGLDVSGNSKLAEEKLDEIIAMPRDLFRKILHKRQKEGGFFLNFTPKDTNDFLMSCLGLNSLKEKVELIDKHLKVIAAQKDEAVRNLQSSREGLLATQNAILGLGMAPVRDMHPEVVEKLKDTLDASQRALTALMERHASETAELNKTKPEIYTTPFDRSNLEGYEKQLLGIRAEIEKIARKELDRISAAEKAMSEMKLKKSVLEHQVVNGKSLEQEALKIANEIKKIRESICPTCSQTWANGKHRELEHIETLKKIKPEIDRGKQAEAELIELKAKIDLALPDLLPRDVDVKAEREQENTLLAYIASEKEKEKQHNIAENMRVSEVSGQFSLKVQELSQKHQKESEQLRGQVDIDRRAYDAANYKLHAYETAKVRYEQSVFELKNQESKYLSKVEELENKVKELELKVLMTEEGKRALKVFISCSFDDALETISAEATKIIRHIPNMANATIQLEGTRETASGKVKEEVNAVIHVDGEENVPLKSLSGGERSAVDLAIDLAVIDLIESKTGKGINFFILDEPFTGLGSVEIEMALEVLKNSNSNKKLIIVDHNPEVKQMVHNRIVVVRDGITSRIS